jgi:mRNA interferase MazF
MKPEQGDIVLVPVPFTDLTAQKRRPVIVVSNNSYNRESDDIVVVSLTSTPPVGQYSFILHSHDLLSGPLKRPSTVRVDKVYTLAQSIILKRFGRVKSDVLQHIRELLAKVVQ